MIRTLILYYLNVKPTHGYEIQKFLQVSGADNWTKIQSGSIYYALSKLEKDGCVKIIKEEKNGSRIRKIYAITERGKLELKQDLQQELLNPITPIGSDKFLLGNILDELPKDVIRETINKHIIDLRKQKLYWEKWKQTKDIEVKSLAAEKIAFDMTIDSLKYQILWHEEILNNIDEYLVLCSKTRQIIKSIDFSTVDDEDHFEQKSAAQLVEIEQLRDEIVSNPAKAVENIDKFISKLKKKNN